MEEISSKLRVIASKCSSSSSSSIFSSSYSSSSNPHSDSNLRSSWGTKGEAPFTDSVSNSNSDSNLQSSFTNSNLRSSFTDSNSDSRSNSDFNSNLQSNWCTKGEAPLACHGRCQFTDNHIETKFDITNKICNRCRVIKQITCFDKK